jgi:hypothetical protein
VLLDGSSWYSGAIRRRACVSPRKGFHCVSLKVASSAVRTGPMMRA